MTDWDDIREQIRVLTQNLQDSSTQANSTEKPKHEEQIVDCPEIILKTYFKERNEIHRISCPDPTKANVPSPKYSWLREKIATCFNLAVENFCIEFVDHEQDNVSITNDDEFKDALKQTELVKEAPAPILRLYLYSRETIYSRSKIAATGTVSKIAAVPTTVGTIAAVSTTVGTTAAAPTTTGTTAAAPTTAGTIAAASTTAAPVFNLGQNVGRRR